MASHVYGRAAGDGGDASGASFRGAAVGGALPSSLDVNDAAEVSRLCRQLYESADPGGRAEAERALLALPAEPDALAKLKQLFRANAQDAYAQLFVFSALSSVLTSRWAQLRDDEKAEVRAFAYGELLGECGAVASASSSASFAPVDDDAVAVANGQRKYSRVVLQQLVLLAARVCKLGWLDDAAYRLLVRELLRACKQLAGGGGAAAADAAGGSGMGAAGEVALATLTRLVSEINQPLEGRTATQHRKTAVSFRDEALHPIFSFAVDSLTALARAPPVDESASELRSNMLRLSLACLTFDFIGTALDDAGQDLGTIQVPQSWRSAVEASSVVPVFLSMYTAAPHGYGTRALECIVQLASVRRSLFSSDAARSKYLREHLSAMVYVLRSKIGVERHENYHHVCRWLARLKCNYQLAELVVADAYKEWIELVASFTVHSFSAWQWASGSLFYLLVLWNRLVASMPYLRGEKLSLLDTHVEQVVQAYVTSRLDELETRVGHLLRQADGAPLSAESVDNALEHDIDEGIEEQSESLSTIFRLQYDETSSFLVGVMDARIERYAHTVQSAGGDGSAAAARAGGEVAVLEAELTWLVHLCTAVVGSRISASSSESQETSDGVVAARVFQLVRIVDARLAVRGLARGRYSSKLDMALLEFLQGFRRAYIGDHAVSTSHVYSYLGEHLGVRDHMAVLDLLVTKVLDNLRLWPDCGEVLSCSLNLLLDLAQGYSSSRLLLKLDAVKHLLRGSVGDSMQFMESPRNGRLRTLLYHTTAKLMFQSSPEELFADYVAPVTARLNELAATLGDGPQARERARQRVAGACRDLRGIVAASTSRRMYALVFEWLFPAYTPLARQLAEVYATAPDVAVPLLKFWSEFVYNKSQRLVFDSSSANGILLFRESSALIVSLGEQLARTHGARAEDDVYAEFYKPVWLLYQIMTRSLTGNYVNFGVFALYGDPALNNALSTVCTLMLCVPLDDLMAYPKLLKAHFAFVEALCGQHMSAVVDMDQRAFVYAMQSVLRGLQSLEVSVSSQCAAALDNVAAFYYNKTVRGDAASDKMRSKFEAEPALLPRALHVVLELLLFEDCANQWSLSRPLLGMIVINGDAFVQLKARLIDGETRDERRRAFAEAFEMLMRNVQPNLDPKNRDRFTQNVTAFRHTLRAHGLLR